MEKQEAIKQLANGTGITLFCTPQGNTHHLIVIVYMLIVFIDVNLNMAAFGSIDKNHEQMLKVMPPTVPATSQARPMATRNLVSDA
jgi:hypothetical protein